MIISDVYVGPNEFREIVNDLGGLPGIVLVFVIAGGLIGFAVAAAVKPLPAVFGILAGMALGFVVAGGINSQASPLPTAPLCRYGPEYCQPPVTFGTLPPITNST
jgi:hypothetical protein